MWLAPHQGVRSGLVLCCRGGGGQSAMGGNPDPTNMSEAEYLRMWEDYSRE